jgi:hypothetical protein
MEWARLLQYATNILHSSVPFCTEALMPRRLYWISKAKRKALYSALMKAVHTQLDSYTELPLERAFVICLQGWQVYAH